MEDLRKVATYLRKTAGGDTLMAIDDDSIFLVYEEGYGESGQDFRLVVRVANIPEDTYAGVEDVMKEYGATLYGSLLEALFSDLEDAESAFFRVLESTSYRKGRTVKRYYESKTHEGDQTIYWLDEPEVWSAESLM